MMKNILCAFLLLSFAAQAAEYTFKGSDGQWGKAENWSPEGIPGGGDTAIFNAATTIQDAFAVSSGILTIKEAQDVTLTINGVISGGGGLVHNGTGTLELKGLNTFTGPYTNLTGNLIAHSFAVAGQPSAVGAGSGEHAPLYLDFANNAQLTCKGYKYQTDRRIIYKRAKGNTLSFGCTSFTIAGGMEGAFWFRGTGDIDISCRLDENVKQVSKTDYCKIRLTYPDNTFNQEDILIGNGEYYVTKLANIGEPSSVGVGKTIRMSQDAYDTPAYFKYTGTVGTETDKNFKIAVFKDADDNSRNSATFETVNAGVKVKYTGTFTKTGVNNHAKFAMTGNGDIELATAMPKDFGFYKDGLGTLTLSADNLATGLVNIVQGRMDVMGSLPATRGVNVRASGGLGGSGTVSGTTTVYADGILYAGTAGTLGTLTFDAPENPIVFNQGSRLYLKADDDGNCDAVHVAGKPVFEGDLNIVLHSLEGNPAKPGTYTIMTWDEAPERTPFVPGIENLLLTVGEKGLTATVQEKSNMRTWVGDGTRNVWDFTTANWDGGLCYKDASSVQFTSTGSMSPSIDIAADVSPLFIVVNNPVGTTYTFTGQKITGQATLTKKGAGTLVLANTNTYNGATAVNEGTLALAGKVEGTSISVADEALLRQEATGCIAGENVFLSFGSTPPEIFGTNTFTGCVTFDFRRVTENVYMYLAHPRALGQAEKIMYYPSPKKENYLLFTNNGTYATPIEIVRLASEYGLRMGVANVVPNVRATFNANIWQTGTDKEVNITFYSNKGGVFTVGEEGGDTFIEGDQILTRGDATVVCNAMLKCKSFYRNDKGTVKLCSSRNGTYGVLEHQQGIISLHAEHAVNPACVYRIGKDSELWEGSHHSELNLNGFDMEVAALIEDDIGKGGWRKIRAGDAPATLTVGSDTQDSFFGSHSRYGDGTLSGALSIVKKGAAAFDLNGTNSFTGSVTVHGGVLNARAKNALGQGTLIEMKGGTLALFDSESASTNATLRLASLDGSKGMLSLADGVEQKIQYIEVGGVIGPEGTYGSLTSQAAHKHPCFAGNGILHVLRGRSGLVITLK